MNPILKKKLSILIHLACADGDFATVEKSFIAEIAERNGVTKQEISELIANPEPIGSLGALSYEKAVEYMSDSLSLVAIDNKIQPGEVILCEDIGLRLGFQKKDIDSLLDSLKQNTAQSYQQLEKAIRALDHSGKL